uniref:Uncharacterized protein n=1 Tax=Meloidogyne enterolobii TaxID=390850 RepID=A0A6V7WCV3_MELEN|nr:unnamed protein product [Meloidogyne enterolobii]
MILSGEKEDYQPPENEKSSSPLIKADPSTSTFDVAPKKDGEKEKTNVGNNPVRRPRSMGGSRQVSTEDEDVARKKQSESRKRSTASQGMKHKKMHPAERRAAFLMANTPTTETNSGYKKDRMQLMHSVDCRAPNFLLKEQIMEKFERHSTIHGICHASLAPNKRWRRFWLGVFTVCFVIMVIQVIYLVLKYLRFPKTVDLDLKFENAPFPSVTFCNLNPYKASAIGEDSKIQATLDAFKDRERETGHKGGIAASLKIENAALIKRRRRELARKARLEGFERRYLQVYAQCYCEINRLSAERKPGSCFAAYKGKISLLFATGSQLQNFHPTKCLCQFDWISKTLWPCFPYNTWKEHICTECVDQLGHCPMRFYSYDIVESNGNGSKNKGAQRNDKKRRQNDQDSKSKRDKLKTNNKQTNRAKEKLNETNIDVCICHQEYNHCVQNNINGEIPDILPSEDLEGINFTESFATPSNYSRDSDFLFNPITETTTTTTTRAPDVVEAMGYEELEDEIAIRNKAQENLRFAMGEKPINERKTMSQSKDELILKCSFNQRDCDIEKDFKQIFDPTYGNCYTFNWNRNATVTAYRAGANYGLKVMLYANVSEYLSITEAVGFRITVHDKWTVPFADAFGYNAPTGFMSAFGVRMKKFFRLEPPYGHCSERGDNSKTYIYKDYSYSIEGCHRSCTQQEIIRICGCADPLYPVPNSAHACPVSDPDARRCIDNATREISDLISQDKLFNCTCPQPCRETGYEVTYSAARWPSGTTNVMECKSSDDLCMEKYRTNAAMIQVFYEELNYETLSESPAYGLTSLIADLGGLTGLWIGISIVSILEVVQLIWFCLDFYHTKKVQVKRSSTPLSSVGTGSISKLKTSKTPSNNPSLGGRSSKSSKSLPKDISVIKEERESRQSKSSSSSTSSGSRKAERYLGPGEELPCTCLYGSRGQIVFMKPLCPFHGYMVRRCSDMYSSDEEGNEEDNKEHADNI